MVWTIALVLLLVQLPPAMAEDKPTSLSDARAAIDANLRTPEGKAYDEKLGKEFMQKHLGTLRQCKQAAGNDLGSFWILMKLDRAGGVTELLLYPSTKVGTCARQTPAQSQLFSAAPPGVLGRRLHENVSLKH